MNLLSHLDSFKNNQNIITYNQSTTDIINAILRQHNKSLNDYDKLYYFFNEGNCYDTAKKVFNYLKNNIKYVIEPENLQTIKTPSAILSTGKTTGSDCKNYSLFMAGIMDAYRRNTGDNFNLCFRFASYDNSKVPEHVFVVIDPGSKNEIWCDPVLNYFNEKKLPNFKKDKNIKNMALMSLSGITTQPQQMNGVLDFITKGTKAATDLANPVSLITGSISSLVALIGQGHTDYYYYDLHYGTQKDDLVIEQAITWYNKGQSINLFDFSRIWSDTNTKYPPKRRIDMLVEVYNRTQSKELIPIINAAVDNGLLPASNKISIMSNLFPGGQTTPGATGGMSMTIPLIIGAAAVIGFLIFKKK
jgi:hypothetical protein